MFAAAVAAERGVPCVLFERKARLGSKVLMTANGRCNFAKDISPEQFLNDLSRGGVARACAEFVAEAVRECPPRQICPKRAVCGCSGCGFSAFTSVFGCVIIFWLNR